MGDVGTGDVRKMYVRKVTVTANGYVQTYKVMGLTGYA